MTAILEKLQAVEVERPADLAFRQLRRLIAEGDVRPGEALPPERRLAERLDVSRIHVREALQKLEFYGFVRTRPQSGTLVASRDVRALDGLFEDVLAFDRDDLAALMEVRAAIEIQAARIAAARATDEDIASLRAATDAFRSEVRAGNTGIEHDLAFHRKLAEASGNRVMRTLVALLAPDVIRLAQADRSCRDGRSARALAEHEAILEAIAARDSEAAARAMADHFAAGAPLNIALRGKRRVRTVPPPRKTP